MVEKLSEIITAAAVLLVCWLAISSQIRVVDITSNLGAISTPHQRILIWSAE